ncbi:hypothetical protein EDD16DRAFT_1160152 [Pisolithus croceorrhizus]|nr:hypothetical protein EDD16DRAFT_1160152 [Pisolithus croceorrhizus]
MLGFIKSATTRALRSPPAASDQTTGAVGAGAPNDTTVAQESTLAKVESGTSTAGTVSKSVYSPTARASLKGSNAPDALVEPRSVPLPDSPNYATSLAPPSPVHGQDPTFLTPNEQLGSSFEEASNHSGQPTSDKDLGRFSFLSLPFLRSESKLPAQSEHKSTNRSQVTLASARLPSVARNAGKKSRENKTFAIRSLRKASTEKRVKESAMLVRSLIVGDCNSSLGAKLAKTSSTAKNAVRRVHSHLSKPKSASKVIAHLKCLPPQSADHPVNPNVPLRAVCLDVTDDEARERYFSKLGSVASASVAAVSDALRDVHIVHLLAAPNMGFGAPATASGVFAGAVPTAGAVLEGIQEITPQLLALGYATGKAIMPNHKGVIVPTDRVSVLTYWWGFELCLPSPTLAYIQSAATPGSALLDLLTAISVLNEGVREILPFIRYLAQFVQIEWHSIHAADEGKGVVCCATWIMPIALVPRAWDFTDPPQPVEQIQSNATHSPIVAATTNTPIAARLSTTLGSPKASTDAVPRVSSAFSEVSCDEDEVRPAISSEPPVLPELVVSSPASTEGIPEPVDGSSYVMSDEGQCHGSEAIVL